MATKRRKVPGEIREVLAQNISRLMDQRYQESSNRPMALARDSGCSLSSVQRILGREAGASIDTVESFARVFKLPTFQLLVPWGLLGELATPGTRPPGATKRSRRPLFRGVAAPGRSDKDTVGRRRRRPS